MPLVAINATSTACAGLPALRAALDTLPADSRITVMIHGYKFAPGQKGKCPHEHILSFRPPEEEARAVSWPKHLQVGNAHLGIAFGWDASGSLWRAWHEAERAGRALARLLNELAANGRQVDVIAHSLGARVALTALRYTTKGAVRRKILIAPAEFQSTAEEAMMAPAGQTARVINVTSGENTIYDRGLKWLISPHRPTKKSLGVGLSKALPNWTELRIDDPDTLKILADLGYRIAPPVRRICHWSGYLRPGLFPFYRAVLSGSLPLDNLSAALSKRPAQSRFVDWVNAFRPLSFIRKTSF